MGHFAGSSRGDERGGAGKTVCGALLNRKARKWTTIRNHAAGSSTAPE